MKNYLLLFLLLSSKIFSQSCDSLIVIYTTNHPDFGPITFANLEIDSLQNGLVVSKNIDGNQTRFTYDGLNRLQSMIAMPDSNYYYYDASSRLIAENRYRYSASTWDYRTDTSRIENYYSTHGLDSTLMYVWNGSSFTAFSKQLLFYNGGDTLYLVKKDIYDGSSWTTDSVTTVAFGNFGNGICRKDTTFQDSLTSLADYRITTYDSLGRILSLWDMDSGYPGLYQSFVYLCGQVQNYSSSYYGSHSGYSDNSTFDSLCRLQTRTFGYYSLTGNSSTIEQYFYVGCSSMAVVASPNITICRDDSTEISAMIFGGRLPYSALWVPSTGLACDTCLVTKAAPTVNTSYVLFASDSAGLLSNDTITVGVDQRPVANITITSIDTVSNCQSAVLQADSVQNAHFGWWKDGAISGYTSHLSILYNGQYVVYVGTTQNCPDDYDTLQFNFFTHTPPIVSLTRDCDELFATTTSASSFQWYYNNQLIVDSVRDTLAFSQNGMYSVIAVDSFGCLSASAQLYYFAFTGTTSSHSACSSSCNGNITTSFPYGTTYNWSNGDSDQTAYSLCPGIYSVTVTDMYGCTLTKTDTIEAFPLGDYHILAIGTSATGMCDGMAFPVDTSNTPYHAYYYWEDNSTGLLMDSLCEGWHTVTITPIFSYCAQVDSFYVPVGHSIDTCSIIQTHSNLTCNNNYTGSIFIQSTTGLPYACYWYSEPSYIANQVHRTQLSAGIYHCMMVDQNGCIDSADITLTEPAPLGVNITSYHSFCADTCFATASGTGGIPPYRYFWCDGTSVNTYFACQPQCRVTVIDSNSCQLTDTVFSPGNIPMNVQTNTIPETCQGCNDGIIIVYVAGGNSPFTYSVDSGVQQSSDTLTNLSTGNHIVCVTSSDGCVSCINAEILSNIHNTLSGNIISVFPNPIHTTGTINFSEYTSISETTFLLYDITGRLILKLPVTSKQFEFSRGKLKAGVYPFEIDVEKKDRAHGLIVIE